MLEPATTWLISTAPVSRYAVPAAAPTLGGVRMVQHNRTCYLRIFLFIS